MTIVFIVENVKNIVKYQKNLNNVFLPPEPLLNFSVSLPLIFYSFFYLTFDNITYFCQ